MSAYVCARSSGLTTNRISAEAMLRRRFAVFMLLLLKSGKWVHRSERRFPIFVWTDSLRARGALPWTAHTRKSIISFRLNSIQCDLSPDREKQPSPATSLLTKARKGVELAHESRESDANNG